MKKSASPSRRKPARFIFVIPCFNEEQRLEPERFQELLANPDVSILFVDDGSRDGTLRVLEQLAAPSAGRIQVHPLQKNGGKGEAVRQGLLRALEEEPEAVGYLDADLATAPRQALRLVETLERTHASVVLGSRVRLLGTQIDRNPARHYLGRVFATAASLALGLPVYDTQCGAKIFRAEPALTRALARPFRSSWAFDVELLGRLIAEEPSVAERFVEMPLEAWKDVGGSKLKPRHMLRAAVDLGRIGLARRGGRLS